MIHDAHLDRATLEWLRESPPPSPWVLQAVTEHARAHPGHASLPLRGAIAAVRRSPARLVRPRPGLRLALVVALAVVALAAGELLFAGYRGVVVKPTAPASGAPLPSRSPIASTAPSPESVLGPARMIELNHDAWRWGRVSDTPTLYADDHQVVLIGAETLTDQAHMVENARHFDIRPGVRGWIYWESKGLPFGAGAYWAEPMVAGVWDPGANGFVVYRFAPDDRIRTVWAIVRPTTSVAAHESVQATPLGTAARDLLDRCLEARGSGDGMSYAACFGDVPQGGWHVSVDAANGGWTSQYLSSEALVGAVDSAVLGRVERSGPMTSIEHLVAYPFVSAGSCLKGIEVVEFDPEWDRIAEQWTFCGSTAADITSLPAALEGAWSSGSAALTLTACSSGEACGRFERSDGNERCVYPLTFVSGDAGGYVFFSGRGNTFGCAWSPWSNGTVHVTVAADGRLTIRPGIGAGVGLDRDRPASSALPSPAG